MELQHEINEVRRGARRSVDLHLTHLKHRGLGNEDNPAVFPEWVTGQNEDTETPVLAYNHT